MLVDITIADPVAYHTMADHNGIIIVIIIACAGAGAGASAVVGAGAGAIADTVVGADVVGAVVSVMIAVVCDCVQMLLVS